MLMQMRVAIREVAGFQADSSLIVDAGKRLGGKAALRV